MQQDMHLKNTTTGKETNMQIVVPSCDKNEDIWEAFYYCMEKYWPEHPKITYYTESKLNPYYKTICVPRELNEWTRGLRTVLEHIQDDQILIITDDCFLRKPINKAKLEQAKALLKGNVALVNFERSWDANDEEIGVQGFKKRKHGSRYEVSLMCGLWDRKKLLEVIAEDSDPWTVEHKQNNCGYEYLTNAGDLILDWGYHVMGHLAGLKKGKWCREVVPFFESEGIKMDYSKRGFWE